MRNPVVIFGLSGSGKSFLSSLLNKYFGYEWIRSDVIRKELAGIKPQESAKAEFGKGIYTEEMTKKVYEEMIRRAKELVEKGKKVVLDATFLKRWQRELVVQNFDDPLFILAYAPEEVIRERLLRRRDVSDADFTIYLKQKDIFEKPEGINYVVVNTNKSEKDLLEELKNLITAEGGN